MVDPLRLPPPEPGVKAPGAEPMLEEVPRGEVDREAVGWLAEEDYAALADAAHSRTVGAILDGIRGRGS